MVVFFGDFQPLVFHGVVEVVVDLFFYTVKVVGGFGGVSVCHCFVPLVGGLRVGCCRVFACCGVSGGECR